MAELIGDDEPNLVTGTEDADILWGRGGFDQLHGLGGDDLYLLTDAFALVNFDVVVEAAGGGNDTVIVRSAPAPGGLGVSYTLTSNVENGIIGGVDTLPPEALGQPPDAPFTLIGNALDNSLTGNRAANTLNGNAGADTLNGGTGLDTLIGGEGDDTYLLLDVTLPVLVPTALLVLPPIGLGATYDAVTEATGGGTDTVLVARGGTGTDVPTSYTLSDNVENGIIGGVDSGQASDLAFSLSGNGLGNSLTGNRAANTLNGNAGADTLDGGIGLDTLIGGAGDDTYLLLDVTSPLIVVTAAAEVVIPILAPSYDAVTEAAGGGTDTVIVDLVPGIDTPRSYTLGANIENGIVAGVDTGRPFDYPFSLFGNALDNSLTGNNETNTLNGGAGADTLDGKDGLDTLVGGAGDDLYFVLDATSRLVGTPIPTQIVTAYDTVTEEAGGGTDTVVVGRAVDAHALTSYTLGANIENGIVAGADTGQATDFAFTLSGNELDNALTGNLSGNTLNGNAGADVLNGGAGIDTLVGGAGDDIYLVLDATTTLVGQPIPNFVTVYDTVTEAAGGGTDTVIVTRAVALHALTSYTLGANVENGIIGGVDFGQALDQAFSLTGNALANSLIGNRANNTLKGGAGNDLLDGGTGTDLADYSDKTTAVSVTLAGAANAIVKVNGVTEDTIRNIENALGGSGNDTLVGDGLANSLFGNGGNDVLRGGAGKDVLDGGSGTDWAYYNDKATAVSVTLAGAANASVKVNGVVEDTIRNIENLLGGSGNDTLVGDGLANALFGNGGNDVLRGGAGKDVLDGGTGTDWAYYNDKTTAVSVTLAGAANAIVKVNGIAEDTIRNIENLLGGSGNDTLVGDGLANALFGNGGNDVLRGGAGKDVLDGGTGTDWAYYNDKTTAVSVTLAGAANAIVKVNGIAEDTIRNIENVLGGSGNDVLVGDGLANSLFGNGGNDVLRGGAGNDALDGGTGTDWAYYNDKTTAVSVTLAGAANAIVKVNGIAEDTIRNIENVLGGSGNDVLVGDGLANALFGNGGNDILNGKAGKDVLAGGLGNDHFVFDTALNASTNVDTISDFNVANDTIRLENAIFTAILGTGTLTAGQFVANASGIAADSSDRIVYETDTGKLFYDINGNVAGGAVQFGLLTSGLALTNADFFII